MMTTHARHLSSENVFVWHFSYLVWFSHKARIAKLILLANASQPLFLSLYYDKIKFMLNRRYRNAPLSFALHRTLFLHNK